MRFKDIEFLIKKIIPEKYLLEKRLKRAIKKKYEKELTLIKKFTDKSKEAIDIGVYRGVYSYELAKYFKFVHAFEPNPLIFPYLSKNLTKVIKLTTFPFRILAIFTCPDRTIPHVRTYLPFRI